jgi:hypothetical protein
MIFINEGTVATYPIDNPRHTINKRVIRQTSSNKRLEIIHVIPPIAVVGLDTSNPIKHSSCDAQCTMVDYWKDGGSEAENDVSIMHIAKWYPSNESRWHTNTAMNLTHLSISTQDIPFCYKLLQDLYKNQYPDRPKFDLRRRHVCQCNNSVFQSYTPL